MKIKKEDQGFLYFRENSKGTMNVKFGPEKYATDTKKFSEILFMGNLNCMTFFSNLTIDEPMDFRISQYENLKLNYHAVLDQAFNDVFKEKKRIYELEELAIEKVNAGETVSPEFEEKIQEVKKEISNRSTQVVRNSKDQLRKLTESLEKNMENLEVAKKSLDYILGTDKVNLKRTERSLSFDILNKFVNDELEKMRKLYIELEEEKSRLV